jgi:hypothetical protein
VIRRAAIDPALSVRVLSTCELRYEQSATAAEDRPPHVRAASGLAMVGGRLAVIQDDAAFIAYVSGRAVTAVALPRGPGGRRRFEVGLGNKMDKLDLEAVVAVGDDLWAFGSGSTEARERIAVIGYTIRIVDASVLYRRIREELFGPPPNIEGAALVGDGLWLFHRGNTGPGDHGPAVVELARGDVERWLANAGPVPEVTGYARYDLGQVDGVGLGFTDAVAVGERVFYLAAAERADNAIDDGPVIGSQLGVIEGVRVRAAQLAIDGAPLKAEGLAFDPDDPTRAFVAIDPDDVDKPARLVHVELVGPW